MWKKLLPTLATIGGFAVTAFAPTMQQLISNHPVASFGFSALAFLIGHWAPSPAAEPAK